MVQRPVLAALLAGTVALAEQQLTLGPNAYTAPGVFPTSLFSAYYNDPTQTVSQAQPKITDNILNKTYPLNLTDPESIPTNDTADPLLYAPAWLNGSAATDLYENITAQIQGIVTGEGANCTKCIDSLTAASTLAKKAPQHVPDLLVHLCNYYSFTTPTKCNVYSANAQGPFYAQMLAYADVGGYDGQYLCQNFITASECERPPLPEFKGEDFWTKPKPTNATPPIPKGTDRIKILHMSDFHVDPRYSTGSEANCTSGLCCRADNPITSLSDNYTISLPAPRFGSFLCDTPWSLAAAAVESIPILTGTNGKGGDVFNMTIFTGDLVSHDPYQELSRDYIEYTETALYDLWKQTLNPTTPLYAVIGNHDSYQQAFDAPSTLPGKLKKEFSWNYEHLAGLWKHEGWIDEETSDKVKAHYGAYSMQHAPNLKIITLNTDLWYRANIFAFINSTHPDNFGFLHFLADELQSAEDAGSRAYIVGHVLSGWDGSNALPGPTDVFYQIVDRYSHVIAGLFWGHTHEDQNMIYYGGNGSDISAAKAQNVGWIGPSITPLTDINSGFRLYEVDAETWDILDAHTWYSNVSTFPSLDSQLDFGPSYAYEYNTRSAYGSNISWPSTAPLNATWWHLVTEQMESDGGSLVNLYNAHQGKMSTLSPNCTSEECIEAKVCYIRSGSGPLAMQNCPQGYGSVQ
ncbi:hypothetical protein L202_05136 [Cryptococcus amylolentus CBS 6039]|uniref:Calcineurin-like phosphoesterase domain-containing protein n=1 Tax=Cryptococcus amylolentus CBS 6039 TaxID=1295533 RepID=A0A1E3HPI3_9TREE|nr:hypothetical protein L202_05136 [Cryptococcus amylolentus CBS 6039]ODN78055.1 hypothetical protein L202_05136 [Cryptococcus amylolentus CBS 6039]